MRAIAWPDAEYFGLDEAWQILLRIMRAVLRNEKHTSLVKRGFVASMQRSARGCDVPEELRRTHEACSASPSRVMPDGWRNHDARACAMARKPVPVEGVAGIVLAMRCDVLMTGNVADG